MSSAEREVVVVYWKRSVKYRAVRKYPHKSTLPFSSQNQSLAESHGSPEDPYTWNAPMLSQAPCTWDQQMANLCNKELIVISRRRGEWPQRQPICRIWIQSEEWNRSRSVTSFSALIEREHLYWNQSTHYIHMYIRDIIVWNSEGEFVRIWIL